MWTGAAVLLLLAGASAITRDQFYVYGPGLDQRLPRGANVSSPQIPLRVPIAFFGESYDIIYVNNYGLLTFRENMPMFLNAEFPLPYPSIAALYANIDTTDSGTVYFRETNESHILLKAEDSVQSNFHNYFDFVPTSVFLATWIDVTYSSNATQKRKNSFQIAVISNGTDSFVELLYPEREIEWIQKETTPGSLPDAKAQAGFIAEDGRLFTLRGSGSHQMRNIVTWSNVQDPGRYVYRVGFLPTEKTIAVPDQYDEDEVEVEEETKTCAQSAASVCHIHAKCVDYQAGICCKCDEGFYGNGKSCIKNNIPLRLNGKLNGALNNVNLNDVNVQAYVVIADGRTYTALTQAPPSLGASLQTLSVLGGVIGWLFAKPVNSAKNGYQLTGGVFNYTADIFYPDTGERVIINQEFLGHDVFDQITFEADIRGTIPIIPSDAKFEMSEFKEQYTTLRPGVMNSVSSRIYTNKLTSRKYEQRVSQTFYYVPCKFAPEETTVPVTLKVVKNYLGYESKENIVRYGTTNKVVLNEQEDSCVEGRNTCAPHSTCVAKGDSYSCVCQSGFSDIYYEKTKACVDIDECAAGTHNCDTNADCYNYEGGFECRCRENYEGNGVSCARTSRCKDVVCGPHSSCVEGEDVDDELCLCDPGYIYEGSQCKPATACIDCSPYGHCNYDTASGLYSCKCNEGYAGNGVVCTLERTPKNDHLGPNYDYTEKTVIQSTTSTTEMDYNENFVLPQCDYLGCSCPEGYVMYKDTRGNDLCKLNNLNETIPTVDTNDTSITCTADDHCPPNAICSFAYDQYSLDETGAGHCVCAEGYEGDGYECFEKTGPTCSCKPGAVCIETSAGQMTCVCDVGYHGDGNDCRPNLSCTNNSDCEYNAECRRDAHNEFVCQCIDGYIKDESDACVRNGQLCNGAVCADHASCLFDSEANVSYCQCDQGYEGHGVVNCSPSGGTCDIANDCHPDATCTQVEATYQCICREGFVGDGYNCDAERSCNTNPYMCDQHASCLKTIDGFECECNSGYFGNGSSCQLNPRHTGNFLVASDGASVYRVPFKVTLREFATPLNSGSNQIAVGIDVDCLSGKIYWGDLSGNTIKRASYDGSGMEQFLTIDVQSPEGISIDWSARNIFWTDSKKLTIEVANIDTRVRKVLFRRDGIRNPRGIAVHPGRGKIFWSDWNRDGPKIEWANMDGTMREVFLDKADVKLPNSLAIDWERDRLCYADAGFFSINCVGIDSLEKTTIASNCPYPFGLAINRKQYYWSDWKTLKIEYIDSSNQQKGQVPIATASRRLFGVAVAPYDCPVLRNDCDNRNGYCAAGELCLPDGQGSRTCVPGERDDNYI